MPDHSNPQPDRGRDVTTALAIFLAALVLRIAYLALKSPLLTADGSYYYAVARNLAGGRGFTIDYVWNYLAGLPPRLPAPSNDYWMPLTSILEAGALKLGGPGAMVAVAMPSILSGAALAAFIFWLTKELFGNRLAALLAAAMWIISAHMVALSASPDCFMPAALLTSLALYAVCRSRREGVFDLSGHRTVVHSDVAQPPSAGRGRTPCAPTNLAADAQLPQTHRREDSAGWLIAAGALAGLAYLTRSDGALVAATFALLWLAANRRGALLQRTPGWVILLVAQVSNLRSRAQGRACSPEKHEPQRPELPSINWRPIAVFAAAFAIIAAPWWVRNWIALGAPFGAPAAKTAFLATYNDIFRLDVSSLNLDTYLALNQTVQSLVKAYALWREVRLLAVMCGLALPFAVWAVAKHPQRARLAPWLVYTTLVLGVTALLFPYPTLKGAFWHLAPGVCVFILAAGASGITDAAHWLAAVRWRPAIAGAYALPCMALVPLAAWYAFTPSQSDVNRSAYRGAAREIVTLREPVRVALTDDSWSLNHLTGLPCAQVPTDGAGAALKVADALGANYLFVSESLLRSEKGVAAIPRCRRFEPIALWGQGADAIHAYHIMPFQAAERIAKSCNARGRSLAAANRFNDAIEAFEIAESYKPDFAPIIANIALACWQAGRRDEARLRAAQTLALAPENQTAKIILQQKIFGARSASH